MKFVSVRDLRIRPGLVWQWLADESELVLTSNGKPFAVLTGVDESRLEQHLLALRRARTQDAVSHVRQIAASRGLSRLGQGEIESLVRDTRKDRSRSAETSTTRKPSTPRASRRRARSA